MSVVVPVATQVGLQLLLQPYAQGVGTIINAGVGVVYPAYASYKATRALTETDERRDGAEAARNARWEAARWLTYWGAYGALFAVERVLDKALPWVPYYQTLKLAFLLWLQVPRYGGAQRLYTELVRPYLVRAQPHIDFVLHQLYSSMRQPTVVAALEAAHHAAQQVPVLEWFVRGPDGQPAPRRSSAAGGFITSSASDDRQD